MVEGDGNGFADIFVRDLQDGTTERVTVSTVGGDSDVASWGSSISANGRHVGFISSAGNLVENDNGARDIFVRDLDLGQTFRASVDPAGSDANGSSIGVSVNDDGSVVAFSSEASNLVEGDTNGLADIFVRDLDADSTTRVSVSGGGAQASVGGSWAPSLTFDGRFVTFLSEDENLVADDSNGFSDIFSHDRQTGRTVRLSVPMAGGQASDFSRSPSVSGDGRYVAFESPASDLVSGDTNGFMDVFVAVGPAAVDDVVRIIPGAASAPGAGEAYFVTDVRIYNPDTESPITVFLSFLERGADNSRAAEMPVEIPLRRGVALNDILATFFGLTEATGAIRMRSDREFFATSRTYNVGGEAGTFGSFIPSLNANEALTQGILLQVANNPADVGFRSNVGFTNPGLIGVTVRIRVFNADTGELVGERNLGLPPRSFSQKNVFQFLGQKDLLVMNGSVEFKAKYPVLAYTTVIDNTSDDPTCVLPYADGGTPP
jgi:Tol biopolymer transport system component